MPQEQDIQLVYDKECPACRFYCLRARVRETVGPLILVDARDDSTVVDEITAAGLDIDQGIVLKVGAELYYGADAIHMLSMLSSRTGVFNRLTHRLFRSKRAAQNIYPILRSCRNLFLKILGKSKINNLELDDNQNF